MPNPTSLDDLQPAPYNPRKISPIAREGLKASVAKFGDISGIVWNSLSGHLVSGHQRVEVLKRLHGTWEIDPPGIRVGEEFFEIRVVEWDEATEQAANISANNQKISGAFTSDLPDILDGLKTFDAFDDLRLADILPEDIDYEEAWNGMPEFVQKNKEPIRTLHVHFFETQHVDEFVRLLGQTITDKTKCMYFPEITRHVQNKTEYHDGASGGDGGAEPPPEEPGV